jgi:hypothetical protein
VSMPAVRARNALPALALATAFASVASAEPQRWVVAIGNNHGLKDDVELHFAERDAQDFARVMSELGAVRAEQVRVVLDPTVAELDQQLSRIAAAASPADTLIVYYSGHGSQGDLHLRGARLPRESLEAAIAKIPAQLRVLFVDACRGVKPNAEWRSKGFIEAPPIEISNVFHRGLVVIHSAAPGEIAAESNRLEGGVFSHHLVHGLRGAADADGDTRVNLQEAYTYAYHQTRFETQSLQNPVSHQVVEGVGPLVLTALAPSARTALLVLPSAAGTRYRVYAKGSHAEVAEAAALTGRPLRLALPPGHYVIARHESSPTGARADLAKVSEPATGYSEAVLASTQITTLSASDFRPAAADELSNRGPGGHFESRRRWLHLELGAFQEQNDRGPALSLGYEEHVGPWTLGGDLGASTLSRTLRDSPYFDEERRSSLQLAARVGRRWETPWVSWQLATGLFARKERQTLRGIEGERTAAPWGAGPLLSFVATLPLSTRWQGRAELCGQPTAFRQDNRWIVEPRLRAMFGVNWGL